MKSLLLLPLFLVLASCQTPETQPLNPTSSAIARKTPAKTVSGKKPNKKTPTNTPTKAISKAPEIKPYPLDTCLVTDEPLNEWDEMQRIVYNNQEMKFCCKMCLKKFRANPEKYLLLLPQS